MGHGGRSFNDSWGLKAADALMAEAKNECHSKVTLVNLEVVLPGERGHANPQAEC